MVRPTINCHVGTEILGPLQRARFKTFNWEYQPVDSLPSRRFPIGAELVPNQGTHLRVWAPAHRRVAVVERQPGSQASGKAHVLQPEEEGYHSGLVKSLHVGSLYSFRLDEEETLFPDPASRFQ